MKFAISNFELRCAEIWRIKCLVGEKRPYLSYEVQSIQTTLRRGFASVEYMDQIKFVEVKDIVLVFRIRERD